MLSDATLSVHFLVGFFFSFSQNEVPYYCSVQYHTVEGGSDPFQTMGSYTASLIKMSIYIIRNYFNEAICVKLNY